MPNRPCPTCSLKPTPARTSTASRAYPNKRQDEKGWQEWNKNPEKNPLTIPELCRPQMSTSKPHLFRLMHLRLPMHGRNSPEGRVAYPL
ncbi:hypothetical protein TNCV_401791 [Trichonephila clavipes]|nr:hypothetical protein TNCV_401791 [Trichonephila clavipes]